MDIWQMNKKCIKIKAQRSLKKKNKYHWWNDPTITVSGNLLVMVAVARRAEMRTGEHKIHQLVFQYLWTSSEIGQNMRTGEHKTHKIHRSKMSWFFSRKVFCKANSLNSSVTNFWVFHLLIRPFAPHRSKIWFLNSHVWVTFSYRG